MYCVSVASAADVCGAAISGVRALTGHIRARRAPVSDVELVALAAAGSSCALAPATNCSSLEMAPPQRAFAAFRAVAAVRLFCACEALEVAVAAAPTPVHDVLVWECQWQPTGDFEAQSALNPTPTPKHLSLLVVLPGNGYRLRYIVWHTLHLESR